MSDQWTDNPDVASEDATEVLPDTVAEASSETAPVSEGLDSAVGAEVADEDAYQVIRALLAHLDRIGALGPPA